MKKLFVPASALLVLFASCSKDNNSPKPPANSQLIQGSWNGVSIVKRGFAKGVAIGSDSSLTPVFKTAILTFRPTSVADSITGTAGIIFSFRAALFGICNAEALLADLQSGNNCALQNVRIRDDKSQTA